MQALLDSKEIYGVYECHGFSLQDEGAVGGASSSTSTVHDEIEQLLVRYESLFQIPTGLPPSRVIDHRIHLLPSTKPVNKDGSYRFCVDYRALNTVTIKYKFPIPTADEMFDELGGASIFTKLDLRAGYHQIRVHERDIYKTTFRTHEGHYEFLVMPFGLTNAPLTFQATMNRRARVFGSYYSARGVEMDPKKLLAARDWPEPKTQRQMRGFLGLVGYYRSLPNFDQAFVIEADASGDGIGAVLMQENRPISYFSRKLGPRMRVAATYQKELFAIVEAVYKWRQYLLGSRFIIRTDHKSIRELMQQVKNSTKAVGGYLLPLPTPMAIWEDVSMDFITGLSPSKGNTVILVVVDRLSKYAHFVVLPTSFNAHKVAEVFLEIVVKHHGVLKIIVSDLDPIFVGRRVQCRDLVLVKLQPYRQITLANWFSNKLAKRYYGPYKVEARIEKVAYRLASPATSKIHPVFHVSILKPFVGDNSVEAAGLPKEFPNDQPLEQPLAVCDARMVLRSGVPAQQVLVQWMGGSPEEVTWEWISDFQAAYLTFNLEDKVVFEGGGNDTSRNIHQVRKSGRETKAPTAGLSNCNPVSSPMVTSSSLSLDDSTAFSSPVEYQQAVGSLQYVTLSRPDIAFAVNKVCQYMHAPIENHCSAVKRIFRYLHGTVKHGMLIRRSSGSTLQAFTDVLWKGNPDTSLEAFSDVD
nr:hypothetical protein [Tanacetum cinerariifolium]